MSERDHDIVIAGGGIAGLTAAIALGRQGHSVLLVDPGPAGGRPDPRSTAYLDPSRRFLDAIGIWPALAPQATELAALRVIDSAGSPALIQTERVFQPQDVGCDAFGWNVPNDTARAALIAAIDGLDSVQLAYGVGITSLFTRTTSGRPFRLCSM